MDRPDLTPLLDGPIVTWKNEVVEFAQAGNDCSTDDIGKYFPALANEANLRGADAGWLEFGVNNKTRYVAGTDYLTVRDEASRADINQLLLDKQGDPPGYKQKANRSSILLTELRRRGTIENAGSDPAPNWQLAEE